MKFFFEVFNVIINRLSSLLNLQDSSFFSVELSDDKIESRIVINFSTLADEVIDHVLVVGEVVVDLVQLLLVFSQKLYLSSYFVS